MEITWDDDKASSNLKKHAVSFEEAVTVLLDALAETFFDDMYCGEERFITLGYSAKYRLVLVIWCETDNIIRIISARKATKNERWNYEKGIRPEET